MPVAPTLREPRSSSASASGQRPCGRPCRRAREPAVVWQLDLAMKFAGLIPSKRLAKLQSTKHRQDCHFRGASHSSCTAGSQKTCCRDDWRRAQDKKGKVLALGVKLRLCCTTVTGNFTDWPAEPIEPIERNSRYPFLSRSSFGTCFRSRLAQAPEVERTRLQPYAVEGSWEEPRKVLDWVGVVGWHLAVGTYITFR